MEGFFFTCQTRAVVVVVVIFAHWSKSPCGFSQALIISCLRSEDALIIKGFKVTSAIHTVKRS